MTIINSALESHLLGLLNEQGSVYAPRVMIAESLFVLCKKLEDNSLSATDHAAVVADLSTYMGMIVPPSNQPSRGPGAQLIRSSRPSPVRQRVDWLGSPELDGPIVVARGQDRPTG
jgi:hypothetical protein